MTDVFIAAYLVVQVAVPLGYYLGLRAPADERFAWRMFSAVRLDTCATSVMETTRDGAGPLRESLQLGWRVQLTRGQPRVVERVVERACKDRGASAVTLIRRCRAADGTAAAPEEVVRTCPPPP